MPIDAKSHHLTCTIYWPSVVTRTPPHFYIMSVKSAVNLLLFSVTFGGGSLYSYIISPIAFKHLKREEFSNLQNKVFPLYFLGQATAPILIGLTAPMRCADPVLAVSAVAGALNYFWALPVCKRIKEDRNKLVAEKKHETIVDGNVQPSEEYTALSKQFGKYHGISSLLNMVSLVTLGFYGFALSKRF